LVGFTGLSVHVFDVSVHGATTGCP
jgi:hypothetical protein